MSYAIMRRPCIMEDEGRHEFIDTVLTRADAERWIAAQVNEYFTPQDYYILESSRAGPSSKDR